MVFPQAFPHFMILCMVAICHFVLFPDFTEVGHIIVVNDICFACRPRKLPSNFRTNMHINRIMIISLLPIFHDSVFTAKYDFVPI